MGLNRGAGEGPAGRPRVVLVAPSLDMVGGQSIQADRLLRALNATGMATARLLPVNPRPPRPFRWVRSVKYVRTAVNAVVYAWRLLRVLPAADVVHVYSASYFSFVLAPTPALVASKALGKPVILDYHSGEAEDHLRRWKRTALPTVRRADRLVVPSEYLAEIFSTFGLEARVIHNSLDLEEFPFRERPELRPAFLCNRNLEPEYGVDVVLRAFAWIQETLPQASLTIAGEGSERPALEALCVELGCRNVRFEGRVRPSRMAALYENADVVLNASRIDNMPLSLLEAQASGLVVVSSDAGGIPQVVEDGATGLLAPVDRPERLAEQALRLFQEPELAARLAAAARRTVERRCSMESVLPEWWALYRELAPRAFGPLGPQGGL